MKNTKQLIEIEKQLSEYDGEDKVVAAAELKKTLEQNRRQPTILKSGIPSLDRLIHSFEGGELTILSGITGNGKTLFAQTLVNNFESQGKTALFFSYEVTALNFLRSFGLNSPLFYMPQTLAGSSLKWIAERIYEAKVKYEISAVMIDHLHYLIPLDGKTNLSVAIGRLMREIKDIANKYNIAFFLICHTKKTNPDTELGLGDTRDSSLIEQESDNLFFIWRKPRTEKEATLKIAKNRRMGVFGKKIHLIKSGNFLRERVNV